MFVVTLGPACHSLRFAMMEVSVVLSRSYLCFAVDHVGVTSFRWYMLSVIVVVAGPRPE